MCSSELGENCETCATDCCLESTPQSVTGTVVGIFLPIAALSLAIVAFITVSLYCNM